MIKVLALAAVALVVFIAVSGTGPNVSAGADSVRAGITSLLPSSVRGQGDEQDGDTEAEEPDDGSQDRQAGDSANTSEPDSGSDP